MIAERLEQWANKRENKTALQIKRGETYQKTTYGQLWRQSLGVASLLRQSGIEPGDRVALFASNCPEWVIAYFGVHFAGAVVVPIDAQYGAKEVETLVRFSESRAIILDCEREHVMDQVSAELKSGLVLLSIEANASYPCVFAHQAPEDFQPWKHAEDDLMSLIFTSGTTGEPKGVQLTCGNISSNVEGILKAVRLNKKDNILNFLPLHHAYASTAGAFAPLAGGGTVTFSLSLKGADLLATTRETGVTIFMGVPQVFKLMEQGIAHRIESAGVGTRLLFGLLMKISHSVRKSTGIRMGRLLFRAVHRQFGSKLRYCASGGAKLDPAITERLLDLGILMLEGYGLTETAPVISFTPISHPKPGSVGLPLEGIEVRIDKPDASGQGEICMRGPNLMKGYYRKEAATAEVIRDGWFHTGDLGFLDKDGMITITGRAKEIIVLPSGKNIYPEEVEARYESPLIKEICIAPINDAEGICHGLRAIVVPNLEELAARKAANIHDRIGSALTILGASLPSYMRVTDLVLFNEPLPRTRLGKLRRAKIEEMVRQKEKTPAHAETAEIPAEVQALLDDPNAKRFIKRLSELTDKKDVILPSHDLELDLGLDSLTQVQLTMIVEEEFGVSIPDEDFAGIRTVGDILDRIRHTSEKPGEREATLSWSERLQEPPEEPLESLFNVKRGWVNRMLIALLRVLVRLLMRFYFRARIEGLENVPREGRLLICPNHQSYIDPVLVFAMLPERIMGRAFFVGFEDIFSRPPLSWARKIGRVILTGGASSWADSLRLSADVLRREMVLCIFPEGGRTTTGNIMDPRPGVGMLACETQSPVLPVLIEGATETLSTLKPGLRRCRVQMKVGALIDPPCKSQCAQEDYDKVAQDWLERIKQLQKDTSLVKGEKK